MSASGFSLLRISAASCCFSSSTMEAKVIREERGGLPTAPSTQGLRGDTGDTEREKAKERERDRGYQCLCCDSESNKSLSAWTKVESTTTDKLLCVNGRLSTWLSQTSHTAA